MHPDPAALSAAAAHLNADHAAEVALLAKAFGVPAGERASTADRGLQDVEVVAIDQDGLDLVIGPERRSLRVPFPHRLHRAEDLTAGFALLLRAARHTLGLPPAPDPR